jgi:hypothetical protein
MDTTKIAELLAFLFHDFDFHGDATALWQNVIDLIQQIFGSIFGSAE